MNESPPPPSTYVVTINTALAPQMVEDLKQQGFDISIPPNTIFSAKKNGVACTLYKSGKLTVQGKKMGAFIEFYLEPQILKTFTYNYQNENEEADLDLTGRIGIDESGKGDFFGRFALPASLPKANRSAS